MGRPLPAHQKKNARPRPKDSHRADANAPQSKARSLRDQMYRLSSKPPPGAAPQALAAQRSAVMHVRLHATASQGATWSLPARKEQA